jgi:mono/diheme cytochrome c family protein
MRAYTFTVVSLGAVAAVACDPYGKFERPPIHLQQNMDFQRYFEAQEENPFYSDKRAMRPEVEGTVAVGQLRDDPHLYLGKESEDAEDWVRALPAEGPDGKPIEVNEAFLARGKERFGIYCAVCHSASGIEHGTAVQRGMLPPPKLNDERLLTMPVGYFYDVITNGVRNMPPYASQIPVRDRWAIAAYVRVLQRRYQAPLAQVPDEVASEKGWKN